MSIKKHFDKDSLHHAYLLEGDKKEILNEVLEFIESLGIKTAGNTDIYNVSLDSFKVDDARSLKSYALEKSFSDTEKSKKIFIISANSFLLEAQQTLLKIFEEPILNTHFFVITPDASSLLKTFISRFYFISTTQHLREELEEAEKFVSLSISGRLDFIKQLLVEEGESVEEDIPDRALDSIRSRALKFLNALELVLHRSMSRTVLDSTKFDFFKHFFKVREFLRIPGSSPKTLMESVALIVPDNLK